MAQRALPSQLAGFKVPVHVEVVDAFPTTPSANGDKVRRDMLRELAKSDAGARILEIGAM
jgi:acyl-coenzyme A synthetase/AMP-(fatty) acid ligase